MNCVVLCAGLGIRFGLKTLSTPKPALKIGGKPLIRIILDQLEAVGFDDIIVKAYWLSGKLRDAIGDDGNVTFVTETKLTETATFLKKNADRLDGDFMVVNGDTLTNLDFKDIIDFHINSNKIATIYTRRNAVHSGGTYIFKKEILDYIPNEPWSINTDLIPDLLEKNIPIALYFSNAIYFDIATPVKLKQAKEAYKKWNDALNKVLIFDG